MKTDVVIDKFSSAGARLKVTEISEDMGPFTINVRHDKKGEFFDLKVTNEVELLVQDIQKNDKHLLLQLKYKNQSRIHDKPQIDNILCGHDERHWFSASIPKPVTTVFQAKQALKPDDLVKLEVGLKTKHAHKRHKKLPKLGTKIHRQGEFFFVPDPNFKSDIVLKNEPMRGGGSHFHYAQFLSRSGGSVAYVSGQHVISEHEHKKLPQDQKKMYQMRVANAEVHVKGKITHIEHATVELGNVWHKVLMNTETRSQRGIRTGNLFLD